MLRYLRDAVATRRANGQGREHRPERASWPTAAATCPAQRRDIEQRLRDGEILGVVATNALELGIDIGELDAVVCAGYPGSIAATWQRFGRAGRRGEHEHLRARRIERAARSVPGARAALPPRRAGRRGAHRPGQRRDPRPAPEVRGVRAAVQARRGVRLARRRGDRRRARLPRPARGLARVGGHLPLGGRRLPRQRRVAAQRRLGQRRHRRRRARPALSPSSTGARRTRCSTSRPSTSTTASAGRSSASTTRTTRRSCARSSPDYWTDAMTYVQVSVIEESATGAVGAVPQSGWPSGWGEVAIVEKVVGYKKIKFYTHENAGYGDVRLPEMQMHTTAFWLTVPEHVCASLSAGRAAAIDGLRGVGRGARDGGDARADVRSARSRRRRSATPRRGGRAARRGPRSASQGAGRLWRRDTAPRCSSTSTCPGARASPSASGSSATCCSHAPCA